MAEHLRNVYPKLFKNEFQVSRVFRNHSKIIAKIKPISKIIAYEIPVIIIAKEYENPNIIKDKYKIDKHLKESTFSNLFLVT
jgi:hypothetical protein